MVAAMIPGHIAGISKLIGWNWGLAYQWQKILGGMIGNYNYVKTKNKKLLSFTIFGYGNLHFIVI